MLHNLANIFDYTLIHATIRSSTSVLFATLAIVMTMQADILNIGVEGIMLFGAFTAVTVSYFTGSWMLGVVAAMLVGLAISYILSIAHLKYKADIFAAGMAINMLALAITRFLLHNVLHASGSFTSKDIVPIPQLSFEFLSHNEVINSIFNNYSVLEVLGIVMVFFFAHILYKTKWGLRIRSVGLYPMAAKTAGVDVIKSKYQVMLISGLLGGLAGAYMSLGYSKFFAENMVNGRGFMGVAAMYFGGGDPIMAWIGCFIFGLSDSIGARLQAYGFASQFILMIPYIVTVLILSVSLIKKLRKEKKIKSSLYVKKA